MWLLIARQTIWQTRKNNPPNRAVLFVGNPVFVAKINEK